MDDPDAMRRPPRLVNGERLDQPTFHALYEATPPSTRAELINGVVFMPDPFGVEHARAIMPVTVWLAYYAEQVPILDAMRNVTTILGWKCELQPDLALVIPDEFGGQTQSDTDWLRGPPELVAEVADETRYVDLGPKLEDYEGAGVWEYVVRALKPDTVYWFVRRGGRFVELAPGPDGIYRSEIFPGLWLDAEALIRGDRRRLREVIDLGCATPEHAAFAARLAAGRDRRVHQDSI
jgi:Putative restriction endonuclease